MSAKITNIAKNTSYFTFALILQKIISFTYFILVARVIGPEDLGKYYFAISFTTIFSIFIDLGMANVLTREVAKYNEKARDFLGAVLAIKIPLAVLSLIAVIGLINFMGYPEITKTLVYISVISMILDSFTITFFSTIRGFHNLSFESIASVIFQFIVLGSGLAILYLNLGLRFLMWALALASVFNFIYSASLVRLKWKIRISPIFDWRLIKLIVKISIPFGWFVIFQRAHVYLDTILLSVLSGDKDAGLYQVAFKIVFALQFLPMAFTASLYPAFSSYWGNNREQLAITFERAMNYLIIIGLPVSAGIAILADKIILLFKSGYGEATLPLQIIMAAVFFIFLNFAVGSLLNACDRQKTNTINMGIVLVASVIMNLFLIPKFHATGASLTVVATNFLMFILGMIYVPSIVKYRPGKIVNVFLKSLASALVMAGFAFYFKSFLNVFVVVIISGAIYMGLLFSFKGFSREDIISIWNSFIKKTA